MKSSKPADTYVLLTDTNHLNVAINLRSSPRLVTHWAFFLTSLLKYNCFTMLC